MSADGAGALTVATAAVRQATVLAVHGVLDASSYLPLRHHIVKAALDEPAAVLIDISDLAVPTETALTVFTAARWLVGRWPEVPMALVCAHEAGRLALARSGVARYVPSYPAVGDAMTALSRTSRDSSRRRARAELPKGPSSLYRSRELVTGWLTAWAQTDYIPAAKVIATAFVENVLHHTDSAPQLRIETDGNTVTIAVGDGSSRPAALLEQSVPMRVPSGLHIVAALCRMWGTLPVPTGKTVWAVLGPENRI